MISVSKWITACCIIMHFASSCIYERKTSSQQHTGHKPAVLRRKLSSAIEIPAGHVGLDTRTHHDAAIHTIRLLRDIHLLALARGNVPSTDSTMSCFVVEVPEKEGWMISIYIDTSSIDTYIYNSKKLTEQCGVHDAPQTGCGTMIADCPNSAADSVRCVQWQPSSASAPAHGHAHGHGHMSIFCMQIMHMHARARVPSHG